MPRPAPAAPPVMSWANMGCLLLLLTGLMAAVFGALALRGDAVDTPGLVGWSRADAVAVCVGGILLTAGGGVGAALAGRAGPADPVLMVGFFMAPLPAGLTWAFNRAGTRVRAGDAPAVRAGLAGGGVFLLTAAAAVAAGHHTPALALDFRGALWATAAGLGLALVAVSLLPARPARPADGTD